MGLACGKWVVVRDSESRDAMSAYFAALIGGRPLVALKALNFKPYCGLSWAALWLPTKAHRMSEDEKGGAGPAT